MKIAFNYTIKCRELQFEATNPKAVLVTYTAPEHIGLSVREL